MWKVFTVLVVCVVATAFATRNLSVYNTKSYRIPTPSFEVLSPRGLRVSIPDEPGIELFGFQGRIDLPLEGLQGGHLSGEATTANDERWTIYDKNVMLEAGDAIYYWLYVQKNGSGYWKHLGKYVVEELTPSDETLPVTTEAAVYDIVTPHPPSPVACDPKDMQMLYIQVNHTKTELANLESEVIKLTKELAGVREIQTELLLEMNTTDNNMLLLSGKIPTLEDPVNIIKTVIREKLNLSESVYEIVSAHRTDNNSIVFTINSFENKLKLLAIARKSLNSSKLRLTSHVADEEAPSIDVRFAVASNEELS